MKKPVICLFLILLFSGNALSQIDDILKKIPGVGDILIDEAVTTSIKDAYPSAYWLNGLDRNITHENNSPFSLNLGAGYYRYRFNTFCLRAGTYAPTEGAGYLVAPLKGSKADLFKRILGRYYEHPEVSQDDVQILLWGIEAGMKFSDYNAAFQVRVAPLLKPEEIALMEVDVKDIAYDLLPVEVKDVFNLYRDIRGKLSNINSTYEDVENLAVKTGIAPRGKGSKNIDAGVWTSVGGKVYIRCYPEGYRKTEVEIFIPDEISISRDSQNRIIEIKSGYGSLSFSYDASGISSAMYKNLNTGEEENISGTIDAAADKKAASELTQLVKKSFGKKRSKKITQQNNKEIEELSSILNYVNNGSSGSQSKKLAVNSLFGYISSLEEKVKGSKGGGLSRQTGLSNISGLVFAPANTSQQRLGTGGPEGGNGNEGNTGNEGDPPPDKEEDKDCKVKVYISQVNEQELPQLDWVYFVNAEIVIEGNDDKCTAEEIKWTLYDVSKERGRYINDKEQYENIEEDLQFSNMNTDYNLTKTTASKQLSGKSQTHQIYIVCNDYGAYGKLKVSVKVKGTWYEAEADGTPDKFITIPLDLNENKIADFWEKQNNVNGKTADWDGDPIPAGQKRNGDGLTNYEEYRGCYIDDNQNGVKHIRLNPMQKEIFVVDPDFLFLSISWEAASGIKAYYMTPQQVYGDMAGGDGILSNKVNFCSGFDKAPSGVKHAIRIYKVTGIPNEDLALGRTYSVVGTPKMVHHINIYVDVIKMWISDRFVKALENLIKVNPKGCKINGKFYTIAKLKYLLDAVKDPVKLNQMVEKEINTTVLHECAHNCNVQHHEEGDPACPMTWGERFSQTADQRIYNILELIDAGEKNVISIYTNLKFCKSKSNCWKQLDVNDN